VLNFFDQPLSSSSLRVLTILSLEGSRDTSNISLESYEYDMSSRLTFHLTLASTPLYVLMYIHRYIPSSQVSGGGSLERQSIMLQDAWNYLFLCQSNLPIVHKYLDKPYIQVNSGIQRLFPISKTRIWLFQLLGIAILTKVPQPSLR
jgi:hypothetical protein